MLPEAMNAAVTSNTRNANNHMNILHDSLMDFYPHNEKIVENCANGEERPLTCKVCGRLEVVQSARESETS
jgi:hypothetical protein